MANENVRDAILKANISNVIWEIYVKTSAANVRVDNSGQTLDLRLIEIANTIAGLATKASVTTEINQAISNLIGGAPETADTLKELNDLISTNKDAMALLNQAIGNKVDKIPGYGLSENNFTTQLKTKLDHYDPTLQHYHNNKAILDLISQTVADSWTAKSTIYEGSDPPTGMLAQDLFLKTEENEAANIRNTYATRLDEGTGELRKVYLTNRVQDVLGLQAILDSISGGGSGGTGGDLQTFVETAVVSTTDWIGIDAPFLQSVSVASATDSAVIFAQISPNATNEEFEAAAKASITAVSQGSGYVDLKARMEKPAINIPVQFVVIKGAEGGTE